MKNILLAIRPEWCYLILKLIKTKEIRKFFPIDFVGWVYIYCTKNGDRLVLHRLAKGGYDFTLGKQFSYHDDDCNGKVIARFWCDKVDEMGYCPDCDIPYQSYQSNIDINKEACLTNDQLEEYIGYGDGYAVNISQLEIFDKPKDLNSFRRINPSKNKHLPRYLEVKAPQNYCYVVERTGI